MRDLRFVWDPNKAKSNQRKHGVSFEEGLTVFYDEFATLIPDPEHSTEEDRFLMLGMSFAAHLIVVCHCYIDDDSVIRIINARRATKHESLQYTRYP